MNLAKKEHWIRFHQITENSFLTLRLTEQNPDYLVYKTHIFSLNSKSYQDGETLYSDSLKQAIAFFNERLARL
jgi:hypothetical protein